MKHTVLVVASLLAVWGAPAHAQYKVVGPDGKITFTDRVPDANQGRVSNVTARGTEVPAADLPFELRQVVQKFPVTIYTASDCDPCKQGRELLVRRGVPFKEHTAITQDDRALWQKVTGTQQAPILYIGKQKLESFNADTWNQTLDVAGYPSTSKLPINYRHADAIPLAPRQAAAQPQNRDAAKAEPDVAGSPAGAGGIRF
jgi:glutaredoxin